MLPFRLILHLAACGFAKRLIRGRNGEEKGHVDARHAPARPSTTLMICKLCTVRTGTVVYILQKESEILQNRHPESTENPFCRIVSVSRKKM
jgi:hypothetical protein